MEHGEDGRGVDDLGTEVAKFHGLDERELVDDIGRIDDTRVGGHEAIDVGPDFEHVSIQGGSNDGCGIVRATTSEVGHLARLAVTADEAAQHDDGIGPRQAFAHQGIGEVEVADVLAVHLLRLDDVAAIDVLGILDDGGHDAARDALAVAHHGAKGARRQFADQEDALVDVLQFAERLVEEIFDVVELFAFEQAADHVEMTFEYELEFIAEGLIAHRRLLGGGDKTIGNSTEGTDHDDDGFGTALDNLFYILDAGNGAHRGATKFEYMHIL